MLVNTDNITTDSTTPHICCILWPIQKNRRTSKDGIYKSMSMWDFLIINLAHSWTELMNTCLHLCLTPMAPSTVTVVKVAPPPLLFASISLMTARETASIRAGVMYVCVCVCHRWYVTRTLGHSEDSRGLPSVKGHGDRCSSFEEAVNLM